MKFDRFCFISLLFTFNTLGGFAQKATRQAFEVVSLPRKAGYNKDQLNHDIAGATTIKQVSRIINSKPVLRGIAILLRSVNKDGENVWWPVNSPDAKNDPVKWIVAESKFSASGKFYELNDIRTTLSDTTFVLDTMAMGFFLSGSRYDNNGFYFMAKCTSDVSAHQVNLVPDSKGYFYLTAATFGCPTSYVDVQLFNKDSHDRILTNTIFFLADDDTRQELTDMVKYLKADNRQIDPKDITFYVFAYIRAHYGKISFGQLTSWINGQLTANIGN